VTIIRNPKLRFQRFRKGSVMARAGIITPTPLATCEEVASFRRTTAGALANERHKGTGPKYKKLGGRVFYDWADVMAWVEENTMTRTDDPRPAASAPTTKIVPPLRT
jgi:hypothetical protein